MKKWWGQISEKAAEAWRRFKAWIVGALAAIGLLSVPLVASAVVTFSWTNPTLNEDGTPLDPAQIVQTNIYCGVDPAAFSPLTTAADGTVAPASHTPDSSFAGLATTGDIELGFGRNDCFATTVADYAGLQQESQPSNVVTKIVTPPRPGAPELDP